MNGKRIGCAPLVEHEESVAIARYYIVAKPYRGLGFGKKLYDFSSPSSDKCNIQTFSFPYLKNYHQKRGFQSGWMVKTYQFSASRAVEGLASSQLPPSMEQILPTSQFDFEKLFAYGGDMLGTSETCKLLLAAWLCHLQESSWSAIDKNGEVVGYLIMSEVVQISEEGYIIAPLYANSVPIACSFLKVAAVFASANNPRHPLAMTIPFELNPEGVSTLEREFGVWSVCETIFKAEKEIPNKCHIKVFSIASFDVH